MAAHRNTPTRTGAPFRRRTWSGWQIWSTGLVGTGPGVCDCARPKLATSEKTRSRSSGVWLRNWRCSPADTWLGRKRRAASWGPCALRGSVAPEQPYVRANGERFGPSATLLHRYAGTPRRCRSTLDPSDGALRRSERRLRASGATPGRGGGTLRASVHRHRPSRALLRRSAELLRRSRATFAPRQALASSEQPCARPERGVDEAKKAVLTVMTAPLTKMTTVLAIVDALPTTRTAPLAARTAVLTSKPWGMAHRTALPTTRMATLRRGTRFLAGMTTSLARRPGLLEGAPGVLTRRATSLAVKPVSHCVQSTARSSSIASKRAHPRDSVQVADSVPAIKRPSRRDPHPSSASVSGGLESR